MIINLVLSIAQNELRDLLIRFFELQPSLKMMMLMEPP